MGKRSNFERRPQDAYDTPAEAVTPLLRFLPPATRFAEPCAGRGDLVRHLQSWGHVCLDAVDVCPRSASVRLGDALGFECDDASVYVTNPPWERKLLHRIIAHLSAHRPTWLLLDANWMFTAQAAPFLLYCAKIVTIGRVKWIPDSTMTGKDDAAWLLFDQRLDGPTEFHGRAS